MYLGVVVGAVQVDDVTGKPANSKEADEHQNRLRQTLPRFNLRVSEKTSKQRAMLENRRDIQT